MSFHVLVFNPYEPALTTTIPVNGNTVQDNYRQFVRRARTTSWSANWMYVHEVHRQSDILQATYYVVTYVLRTNHLAIYPLNEFSAKDIDAKQLVGLRASSDAISYHYCCRFMVR